MKWLDSLGLSYYTDKIKDYISKAKVASAGNADKVNNHTVEANVPASAIFTDTTYEVATRSKDGLLSANKEVYLQDLSQIVTPQNEDGDTNIDITATGAMSFKRRNSSLNIETDVSLKSDNDILIENTDSNNLTDVILKNTKTELPLGTKDISSIADGTLTGIITDLNKKSGTGRVTVGQEDGVTLGNNSTSEGTLTVAEGNTSHAEGYYTTAAGDFSHASGCATKAARYSSHTEGSQTLAMGVCSHAEGSITRDQGMGTGRDYNIIIKKLTDNQKLLVKNALSIDAIYCLYNNDANYYFIDNLNENIMHVFDNPLNRDEICEFNSSTAKLGVVSGMSSIKVLYFTPSNGKEIKSEYLDNAKDLWFTTYSGALGDPVVAGGAASHAEGGGTSALGHYSHSEGCKTIASDFYAHAQGLWTSATGRSSFASGCSTLASGQSSHAEGYDTIATEECSHAEGIGTTANGRNSHSEGQATFTVGVGSHAEGYLTTAYSPYSHSEGDRTIAYQYGSHSEGYFTKSTNFASLAVGKFNAGMAGGGAYNNKTGTAFVIGNGTTSSALSNAFSVQYSGITKAANTITASTTADYAEFFEWIDGNSDNEDRVGYFVTLDGDKIRKANSSDDYILGVVSGAPFVLGNGDCDVWNGMYLRDEFRRPMEELAPKVIEVQDEKTKEITLKEVEGEYEGTRFIMNPAYDPSQEYISRFDRPEWSAVGMLGVLPVRHDGTAVVNGYVTVGDDGIATACEKNNSNSYRVIKSNSDKVVEIIFR